MPDVKREIKIVTIQKVNPDKPEPYPGYPQRDWSCEVYVVNAANGELLPARMYEKVTYKLHETFGPRATQVLKEPPFRVSEEGWGEFDMIIKCSALNKGGEHELAHDLNFREEKYDSTHKVTFKNPKPELLAILRESGPVPGAAAGEENGIGGGRAKEVMKKKGRKSGNVDMERLAEGLQRLTEDDLLQVVQMVHDGKAPDTYIKNDVENGEFHVDLYTLPDNLVKALWEFTSSKADI